MNLLASEFLDSLTWGFRRYNYWAGKTWLTGKLPIDKAGAIKLISNREIIGVWQCFGSSIGEPCQYRDIIVFEVDIEECEGRESLDCVVRWGREHMGMLRPVIDYASIIWWNGGKSLYFFIYFDTPVPAFYELREEWVEFARAIGMDMQEAQAKHAVRVIGTPHPRTGYLGKLLDGSLKPVDRLEVVRVNAFYFLEPPSIAKPVKPQVIARNRGGKEGRRELPRWVQALIDYLKANGELCHFGRLAIATWMLFLGHSEDEIVEVFKSAKDFNEHKTRYFIRYAYEKWISQGKPPVSCKTVAEKCGNHEVPNLECRGGGS